METTGRRTSIGSSTNVLDVIADDRRRHLLEVLDEQATPVSAERLARLLAANESGRNPGDVPDSAVESRRLDLEHVHLPALAEADLVVRDRRAGTVAPTDHPALEDPKFARIVETDAAEWDDVLVCLADERCRIVLSVLVDGGESKALPDVVQEVAAREAACDGAVDEEATGSIRTSLHHVHLPRLDDVGLIEYDDVAGTVAYRGHPALEREWLDVASGETPRPILPIAGRAEGLWRLDEHDLIAECGRTLFESADEELFTLFTRPGLVDDACLRRLRDAVDRGVDVYVGSPADELRVRLRREVPGATFWEPQLDWGDLPTDDETVARLVMADRSTILLGTQREASDDVHAESAITAIGEDNALVLLLGKLLGSRLDDIDAGSEGSLSGIPL